MLALLMIIAGLDGIDFKEALEPVPIKREVADVRAPVSNDPALNVELEKILEHIDALTLRVDAEEKRRAVATEKLQPVVSPTVSARQHAYRCNRCGTTWWHGADSFGSTAAHTCPSCGSIQWATTGQERTVSVPIKQKVAKDPAKPPWPPEASMANSAAKPQAAVQSYCPTGNCPLRRRGR